ncbi:MAG TPA: hypothetical protein VIG74_03760, partial [Alphaproteobacteria bacterium]
LKNGAEAHNDEGPAFVTTFPRGLVFTDYVKHGVLLRAEAMNFDGNGSVKIYPGDGSENLLSYQVIEDNQLRHVITILPDSRTGNAHVIAERRQDNDEGHEWKKQTYKVNQETLAALRQSLERPFFLDKLNDWMYERGAVHDSLGGDPAFEIRKSNGALFQIWMKDDKPYWNPELSAKPAP